MQTIKNFAKLLRPEKNHRSLPILNSILITSDQILTCDLESMTIRVVETGIEGTVLLDAEDLKVNAALADSVDGIRQFNPDDYPVQPEYKGNGTGITLSREEYLEAYPVLKEHISDDDTKQYLHGIFINKAGELVATNGFTLAWFSPSEYENGEQEPFIVPTNTMDNAYRILKSDATIDFMVIEYCPESKLARLCVGDNWFILSRVIQGQFPDYRHVEPKREHTMQFNAGFYDELKRIEPVAKQNSGVVRINGDQLQVKLKDDLKCLDIDGMDNTLEEPVAFNVRLLLYMLKQYKKRNVVFYGKDALAPWGFDVGNVRQVIMPVRVNVNAT